jgi:hypothetical protein
MEEEDPYDGIDVSQPPSFEHAAPARERASDSRDGSHHGHAREPSASLAPEPAPVGRDLAPSPVLLRRVPARESLRAVDLSVLLGAMGDDEDDDAVVDHAPDAVIAGGAGPTAASITRSSSSSPSSSPTAAAGPHEHTDLPSPAASIRPPSLALPMASPAHGESFFDPHTPDPFTTTTFPTSTPSPAAPPSTFDARHTHRAQTSTSTMDTFGVGGRSRAPSDASFATTTSTHTTSTTGTYAFLANDPTAPRPRSPDVNSILARTPRPRRVSSSANLRNRSPVKAVRRRISEGGVLRGVDDDSLLSGMPALDSDSEHGQAAGGSDSDSSIDLHTPLPYVEHLPMILCVRLTTVTAI